VCAPPRACNGRFFYHLLVSDDRYLWDTRLVRNGVRSSAYLLRRFDP